MTNRKTLLAFALSASFMAALCHLFLDTRLAILVESLLHHQLSLNQRELPDLLLWFVSAATAASIVFHFFLRGRPGLARQSSLSRLTAFVLPLAYLAKEILKWGFGRVNSRVWLAGHEPTVFHFFQGGDNYSGFPSGHMAVFTALAAAVCRFYPLSLKWWAVFLSVLAVGMILTGYHFLSDILAGTVVGVAVNFLGMALVRRLCKEL